MTATQEVPQTDHSSRIARFGAFEVDLHTGELRRAGKVVRIQVQPFRILSLLLERAGEIVSREELRERLWPSEFVDFDHSLNAAVRKLREALDDSADNPRFVETLARRGYRFIAPVTWDNEGVPAKTRRWPLIAAAAAVVIAAVALFMLFRPRAATPNPIDAVAVLPFTTNDPQLQYFSDGLTEILIDRLSRVPNLRVMARTTVFAFKNADARKVGRQLGVSGVITGNVRRDGARYQVHVELIDVNDGTQLWGDQFQATSATLSSLQSQISDALTSELRQGVSREERRAVASRYTRDAEAYDHYLWGLHALNNRDLPHALDWFNQAVARDASFAEAYAGLANTYGVMVGYGRIPAKQGIDKVLGMARKALELDPNNAEAIVSIATTKYRNLWDFRGAEADYRRALAINPNYATGHEWYADYLRNMGRWEDARREIELAHRLDPRSPPINIMMCYQLYYERRYREAIAYSRQVSAACPDCAAPTCVANALFALGHIDDALYASGEALPVPKDPKEFFAKAAVWLQHHQGSAETPVAIAAMYARAGKADDAFSWLEKAYEARVSMLTNVNIDPAFDSLRTDPRYDNLLKRIGLPRVTPPCNPHCDGASN